MKKLILTIAVLTAMACAYTKYTHNFDGKWYHCTESVLNDYGDTLKLIFYGINNDGSNDVFTYKYNKKHQLVYSRSSDGGFEKYYYNKFGKVSKMVTDEFVVTYHYDDDGNLIMEKSGSYTIWYTNSISGRLLKSEDSNGTLREYYPNGSLKRLKGYDSTDHRSFDYTFLQSEYDHLGRIVKDNTSLPSFGGLRYKYFTKGNHHYKCLDN